MTNNLRATVLLCAASCCGTEAFSPAPLHKRRPGSALHQQRNSPGFVGFRDDGGYREEGGFEGVYDVRGQVTSRESNLANRRASRSANSDDRNTFDYSSRYSQPPPGFNLAPHMQQQTRGYDGRIQGGSRNTYDNAMGGGGGGGRTFVETDGRPLDVEVEVWDGPNNTPTKVRMYSEDGRQRPMNIVTNYDGVGSGGRMGGGTTSVRNMASMEFPMRASVSGGMGGMMGDPYGMGMDQMDGTPVPSMARGETVQGGALKTFTLPSHVNAAQVTIKSDGLPVNAKVELWGTASHVKQLAEVYNDDGQRRPFAAVIDVPGGENTIAVRNTGPMEYPIQVVVEPVGMGGMGGGGRMGGGYGDGGRRMFDDGYGMMDGGPPGMMMDGPFLPPPPPF
ncbi:hypothetical protein ACHAXT_004199 [Thalassiosira profunda]